MRTLAVTAILLAIIQVFPALGTQNPLEPFEPDENTLLLYHFDEGEGAVAKDSGVNGYDGELLGPEWVSGKFGKALWFDGKDDSVFRKLTPAIRGQKQITVECWMNQEDPSGRQFLLGKDVTFHFDFSGGSSTSMSIYNQGGGVENADGFKHQHLGTGLGSARVGKWHHNAATYDGRYISFFFDGVLRARHEAAKDFLLGVESRGLWVGCYVGTDFWFSGKIDEVRVSDCIRYDPECKLRAGEKVFEMPGPTRTPKSVRTPQKTGQAALEFGVKKLYGTDATGWVYLKPPNAKAAIVGQYSLTGMQDGEETRLQLDVSDEVNGDGTYVLALEPENSGAYIAITSANLTAGGKRLVQWTGQADSKRTFSPPVLVPLQVGAKRTEASQRIVLLPGQVDRMWGDLDVENEAPDAPPVLYGDGYAEYWLHLPEPATYEVHMRYSAAALRPCDIVVDGRDLNDYNMCARNRTGKPLPKNALWELQGRVTLEAGAHWLRVQDVLPDIVALRLDKVEDESAAQVPFERYPTPDGDFLQSAGEWSTQPRFGSPDGCGVELAADKRPVLTFSSLFANRDADDLFAGDCVRFVHETRCDLEAFGQLTFTLQGQGTGHVVSVWLVDAKGVEKLIWRERDEQTEAHEVTVPVSFEGNDVFDPAHVVAVCVELDEGNTQAERLNDCRVSIIAPQFQRRDVVALPNGYADALASAKQALNNVVERLSGDSSPLSARAFQPWTKPVVPEEHPLFAATEPKPVTRETLGYELHFTGARGVGSGTLDDYHRFYDFGDVCWPHIGILPLRSRYETDADYSKALDGLRAQLEEVRDRGLYVFDIWGYVPRTPDFPWKVAPEHHEILADVLGDRFLGFDNGEHDGRYIGGFSDGGGFTDRKGGWEDFVKWNEGICNDSQNFMNATGSLNFSHYYAELNHRTLGLETAQGLPSDTLMWGFLRGASKQYGRLMTQATSVWNRFGWNMYNDRKTTGGNGYGYGPNKGCSLSLHKRLMLSSYLGGESIVGSETAQFTADRLPDGAPELSALGEQHLKIRDWVREHPDRGEMYTPVAFMLDFYNGWNMPRHLYRGDKYKVWGKLSYEKGDYLIDQMLRMVWPGYEDCSYLRNERGFITPTPYGDIFDVITNRCHPEILKQYSAVVLMGDVELTAETIANLKTFVEAGGDVILEAKLAASLPGEMTGVSAGDAAHGNTSHLLSTGKSFDELPYTYQVLNLSGASPLLVNEHGHALLTVNALGNGRVIVGAADYWLTDQLTYEIPEIVNMEPPYVLLDGVKAALGDYFGSFSPIDVSAPGLNVRTCCYDDDPKHLLVGLMNNDLFAGWEGELNVRIGDIASARDIWADRDLPEGEPVKLAIPAGELAIIDVRLK